MFRWICASGFFNCGTAFVCSWTQAEFDSLDSACRIHGAPGLANICSTASSSTCQLLVAARGYLTRCGPANLLRPEFCTAMTVHRLMAERAAVEQLRLAAADAGCDDDDDAAAVSVFLQQRGEQFLSGLQLPPKLTAALARAFEAANEHQLLLACSFAALSQALDNQCTAAWRALFYKDAGERRASSALAAINSAVLGGPAGAGAAAGAAGPAMLNQARITACAPGLARALRGEWAAGTAQAVEELLRAVQATAPVQAAPQPITQLAPQADSAALAPAPSSLQQRLLQALLQPAAQAAGLNRHGPQLPPLFGAAPGPSVQPLAAGGPAPASPATVAHTGKHRRSSGGGESEDGAAMDVDSEQPASPAAAGGGGASRHGGCESPPKRGRVGAARQAQQPFDVEQVVSGSLAAAGAAAVAGTSGGAGGEPGGAFARRRGSGGHAACGSGGGPGGAPAAARLERRTARRCAAAGAAGACSGSCAAVGGARAAVAASRPAGHGHCPAGCSGHKRRHCGHQAAARRRVGAGQAADWHGGGHGRRGGAQRGGARPSVA